MFLKRIATGMLGSNCYIIANNGTCAVIDPGVCIDEITEILNDNNLEVKYIILTHAHLDHIVTVDKLRQATNGQVALHRLEAPALSDSWANGAALFGANETFGPADLLLEDGDVLDCGGMKLEIILTPGHTDGGICIKVEDCIFTGDTLFYMSVGRTDLGRGCSEDLKHSIVEILFKLGNNIKVYPGHGTATTIGFEKENNPFV